MPSIDTKNGAIFYADHRDRAANSPVTVMIHGAGASHLEWPAELRRLPEANAIIPDLSGHGRSSGTGRTSISGYAADIIALLDALDIAQANIAGHSMGGAIAQHLAINYPDRVRGLILVGTGAKLNVNPDLLNALRNDPKRGIGLIIKWQWGSSPDELGQVRRLSDKRLREINPQVIAGDYAACSVFDVRSQLSRIRVPTLIIAGSIDKMTPPAMSEFLRDNIAGARLVTLSGAGHMLLLEQPKAAADAVREWLVNQT